MILSATPVSSNCLWTTASILRSIIKEKLRCTGTSQVAEPQVNLAHAWIIDSLPLTIASQDLLNCIQIGELEVKLFEAALDRHRAKNGRSSSSEDERAQEAYSATTTSSYWRSESF